jgi:hypothetical protein
MARIVYKPYDEIILHEVREMEIKDLMDALVSQLLAQGQAGVTPVANWVNGIAFYIGNFQETPDIIKEKLEGRIHWGFVGFARTSYQAEKKTTLAGRDYIVKFVKVDSNPDFVGLADFLNEGMNKQPA